VEDNSIMDPSIPADLVTEFNRLNPIQQADVLAFMRQLHSSGTARRRSEAEEAARRASILSLAGSIPPEDLAIMSRVIDEDCERIDQDGW
jgi:hypothetical protein